MSTVNGFQVGSETLKYNYESLDNYNTPNFSTSSSKIYAVGDYVMYNGKLYKCTTATTGGTWVSGSWTLAVLSDDVGDLNRHLSDVTDNQIPELKSATKLIDMQSGYIALNVMTVNVNNVVANNTVKHAVIPCEYGDIFTVSAVGGNAARAWGFVAADGKNLRAASANVSASNLVLIAPYNSAYLVINDNGPSGRLSYYGLTSDLIDRKIDSLNNNVNQSFQDILGVHVLPMVSGYFVNLEKATVDIEHPITNTDYACCVVACQPGDVYTINALGGEAQRAWATLDSSNAKLRVASANADVENLVITIEEGATHLVINDKATPKRTSFSGISVDSQTQMLSTQIEAVTARQTASPVETVDFSQQNLTHYTINSSNKWQSSSDLSAYILDISDVTSIEMKGGANGSYYALLSSVGDKANGSTPDFYAGESRSSITANSIITVDTSADNCSWLYVYNKNQSTGVSYIPAYVKFTRAKTYSAADWMAYIQQLQEEVAALRGLVQDSKTTGYTADDGMIRDVPQNRGVLNAYKRAHQLLEIPWTALSTIFDNQGGDISAGNKKGIIYSSVKECDKFVGFDVSIETFMTAAHNPYSMLYTENVNASHSASDYGITYHGINSGSYFGIVCNVFVLYSLGWDIPWNTGEWHYLAEKGILEPLYDQSAYGLQLMDMICEPGHGRLVTDIYRNGRGEPVRIIVSESGPNFPSSHAYTAEEFDARLANNPGTVIYRYPKLYTNLNYEQSPFVTVEGETALPAYIYNDDICTIAGDYAAFREGENVYISYTAGTYTKYRLYKEQTLVDEGNIDTSAHLLNLGNELTYGKYTAVLFDGETESDPVHFEVLDVNVTCTNSHDMLSVTFSSENATPYYVKLCYRDGSSRGLLPLSEDDLKAGSITIDADRLCADQYNGVFSETTYLKVYFKGEYGSVTNDWLDTDII